MTPTEQDSNGDGTLKQRIYEEIAFIFAGKDLSHEQIAALMDDRKESVELIMRLITADRKRVALEARIEAAEHILNTMVHEAGGYCDEIDPDDITNYIAELKAQQEEV